MMKMRMIEIIIVIFWSHHLNHTPVFFYDHTGTKKMGTMKIAGGANLDKHISSVNRITIYK